MRRRLPLTVPGRAILGLVALYALLLQAFLGLAAPIPAPAAPGTVLCAEHPVDGSDHAPIRIHVHSCCTLAQAASVALPVAVSAAPALPLAPALHLSWRPEAELPRTGPPPRAGTARGPPAV
ncbi:hypothetical protein MKK88_28565 [Methylobacterium sp. E-005]|uniref:hypothetical protein n=1 Tax=Methylobacterium sp. E-005 TaxID=2836549 RepID=UPI001FBB33F7|nr:hypothetical protein [Methylobacterium sp. E-005]MCJ2089911.1 hypothetical protein [Methylobacterium sp. E-005]